MSASSDSSRPSSSSRGSEGEDRRPTPSQTLLAAGGGGGGGGVAAAGQQRAGLSSLNRYGALDARKHMRSLEDSQSLFTSGPAGGNHGVVADDDTRDRGGSAPALSSRDHHDGHVDGPYPDGSGGGVGSDGNSAPMGTYSPFERALLFLSDAAHYRYPNYDWRTDAGVSAHRWRVGKFWKFVHLTAVCVAVGLCFVLGRREMGSAQVEGIAFLLDLLCVAVFVTEIVLYARSGMPDRRAYVSAFFVLLYATTSISRRFAVAPHLANSLFLIPRCYLPFTTPYNTSLNSLVAILRILPSVFPVLVLTLVVSLIFACICVVLFGEFRNAGFHELSEAFVNLFQLATSVNDPDVWMPLYDKNCLNVILFVTFLCITFFFVPNLVSATVYDEYSSVMSEFMKTRTDWQRQSVVKAFSELDLGNRGIISAEIVMAILQHLRPHYAQDKIQVLYEQIDPSNRGVVTLEMFTRIVGVLNMRVRSSARFGRQMRQQLKLQHELLLQQQQQQQQQRQHHGSVNGAPAAAGTSGTTAALQDFRQNLSMHIINPIDNVRDSLLESYSVWWPAPRGPLAPPQPPAPSPAASVSTRTTPQAQHPHHHHHHHSTQHAPSSATSSAAMTVFPAGSNGYTRVPDDVGGDDGDTLSVCSSSSSSTLSPTSRGKRKRVVQETPAVPTFVILLVIYYVINLATVTYFCYQGHRSFFTEPFWIATSAVTGTSLLLQLVLMCRVGPKLYQRDALSVMSLAAAVLSLAGIVGVLLITASGERIKHHYGSGSGSGNDDATSRRWMMRRHLGIDDDDAYGDDLADDLVVGISYPPWYKICLVGIVLGRALDLLPLLRFVHAYHAAMHTLHKVLPAIFANMATIFLLLHVYACVGMYLYGGLITSDADFGTTPFADGPNYYRNNFNTYGRSMVTLFELLIVNNWNVISSGYVYVTGTYWTYTFFISFNIIAVCLALNILLAIFISAFLARFNQKSQQHHHIVTPATGELWGGGGGVFGNGGSAAGTRGGSSGSGSSSGYASGNASSSSSGRDATGDVGGRPGRPRGKPYRAGRAARAAASASAKAATLRATTPGSDAGSPQVGTTPQAPNAPLVKAGTRSEGRPQSAGYVGEVPSGPGAATTSTPTSDKALVSELADEDEDDEGEPARGTPDGNGGVGGAVSGVEPEASLIPKPSSPQAAMEAFRSSRAYSISLRHLDQDILFQQQMQDGSGVGEIQAVLTGVCSMLSLNILVADGEAATFAARGWKLHPSEIVFETDSFGMLMQRYGELQSILSSSRAEAVRQTRRAAAANNHAGELATILHAPAGRGDAGAAALSSSSGASASVGASASATSGSAAAAAAAAHADRVSPAPLPDLSMLGVGSSSVIQLQGACTFQELRPLQPPAAPKSTSTRLQPSGRRLEVRYSEVLVPDTPPATRIIVIAREVSRVVI